MAVDIVIPQAGESVTQGVISSWRKKDGDFVKRDEELLDLETDKVTLAVAAPASGVLKRMAKEGDTVPVGAVVGTVEEGAAAPASAAPKSSARAEAKPELGPMKIELPKGDSPAGDGVRATPLARKVAEELGVDIAKVSGTGAGGRVREQDVVEFSKAPGGAAAPRPAPALPTPSPAPVTPVAPPIPGSRGAVRERLSPLRQRVAARLVQAQHTAAMLTTFNECDMTAVMELRKRAKEDFEKRHGVGLGFMSFFVKAAVNALQAFPMVNASLVEEGGQLLLEKHPYCDIAIAVASPKGLVVPVIRNCQDLSMAQIEAAIKDFGARAKDGKLTLEEMQGGTFTITNGGVFGSLMSTPILNPPQSAILGMHAIKNRAVEDPANPGQVVVRPMMYLALSYDHRVIDGAEAVQCLIKVKQAIEDPVRLLLQT